MCCNMLFLSSVHPLEGEGSNYQMLSEQPISKVTEYGSASPAAAICNGNVIFFMLILAVFAIMHWPVGHRQCLALWSEK